MTTPFLIADLERDEGCRLIAYPDPLTRGAPWTIGYGHTGREVHPGLVWTAAQALEALQADAALTCKGLDSALPWWRSLSDVRQDVLASMAFNMGVHGLLGFRRMLFYAQNDNFPAVAKAMLDSEWAEEFAGLARSGEETRPERLAKQFETGLRAA